eukprot:30362-Pelagococcus_subviridis.AAC.3
MEGGREGGRDDDVSGGARRRRKNRSKMMMMDSRGGGRRPRETSRRVARLRRRDALAALRQERLPEHVLDPSRVRGRGRRGGDRARARGGRAAPHETVARARRARR